MAAGTAALPNYFNAHGPRRSADALDRGFYRGGVQVGHLLPGDVLHLLQRDFADFLRHGWKPCPSQNLYATFSTWLNSNSTGVERPKIVTITFSVSRSSFTSSTTPVKLANGPSVMRTDSFFSNLTLSFGFSRLSATL